MKLSQWRPRLMQFLTSRVVIHSWLLERPETYSQVVGFLPPLHSVDYRREDVTRMVLTATQDFIVSQRLPAEISFKDLPLAQTEGYYASLAIAFIANYKDISADVLDLTFSAVETPVTTAEVAEDANDWILDIKWSFRVEIEVEPEDGGIVDPFELKELSVNVYRDQLDDDLTDGVSDPAKRYLDFTFYKYTT